MLTIRLQLQCSIFNTTYNPERLRLGNKILRQRLKGPILSQYYPPRMSPIKELKNAYPEWTFPDEDEGMRLESIAARKARGKGAPKKRTAAGMSLFLGSVILEMLTSGVQSRRSLRRGGLGSPRLLRLGRERGVRISICIVQTRIQSQIPSTARSYALSCVEYLLTAQAQWFSIHERHGLESYTLTFCATAIVCLEMVSSSTSLKRSYN